MTEVLSESHEYESRGGPLLKLPHSSLLNRFHVSYWLGLRSGHWPGVLNFCVLFKGRKTPLLFKSLFVQ